MKGFKKDGKFIPTGNKSKSNLKKADVRKKVSTSSGSGHEIREKKTVDAKMQRQFLDELDRIPEQEAIDDFEDAISVNEQVTCHYPKCKFKITAKQSEEEGLDSNDLYDHMYGHVQDVIHSIPNTERLEPEYRRHEELEYKKTLDSEKRFAIMSDDPEALEKLNIKLEKLLAEKERWKATPKNTDDHEQDNRRRYTLDNLNGSVKSVRDRIKKLENLKERGVGLERNTTYKDGRKVFYYSEVENENQ